MIICLSSCGHYLDECREITKEEYEKLKLLEQKYDYLDAASKKDYKFVNKILKKKPIKILKIIKYN